MNTVMVYMVLAGDTLYSIANSISGAAGVTIEQIETENPQLRPNDLQVVKVIAIPECTGSGVLNYTIIAGDTLSSITNALSQCAGLTYQQIQQNNSELGSEIQVGELLNIPATTGDVVPTLLQPEADNMGYWDWTYSASMPPSNTTMSLAFSGEIDVDKVISNANRVLASLVGDKYICFGGGNDTGAFTGEHLHAITDAINEGKFSDYDGIAYDIEEGKCGLEDDFKASFQAAKEKGFKVLVTVSHSAPYGISDAPQLMNSFFDNENIDFISPQLYSKAIEPVNEYTISGGVQWSEYANCKASVIPSIVISSLYASAQEYFLTQGVTLEGYIQWRQT
jgi:LysM repeat protein